MESQLQEKGEEKNEVKHKSYQTLEQIEQLCETAENLISTIKKLVKTI